MIDSKDAGGESGILTHVRVSPKHAFQACAFSHSAISPCFQWFAVFSSNSITGTPRVYQRTPEHHECFTHNYPVIFEYSERLGGEEPTPKELTRLVLKMRARGPKSRTM